MVDGRIVMSGSLDWTYAAVERGGGGISPGCFAGAMGLVHLPT